MSKKIIESLIKISNNVTTKVVKGSLDNPVPGKKWKAEVEGEFRDMSSKSSFEKIVLDFIKEQKLFNQEIKTKIENVEDRLIVLEKDMKEVKFDIKKMRETPTMKKELKK